MLLVDFSNGLFSCATDALYSWQTVLVVHALRNKVILGSGEDVVENRNSIKG